MSLALIFFTTTAVVLIIHRIKQEISELKSLLLTLHQTKEYVMLGETSQQEIEEERNQSKKVKEDSTGTALVDPNCHWIPISADTPRNKKLQLINKEAGVHTTGSIGDNCFGWTHYCPFPTFSKEEA